MTEVHIDESVFATCKGAVVVIAGGANGIGAATVSRFYHSGAHVVFSDWNEENGRALEKRLDGEAQSNGGTCSFMRVDVSDYSAQLAQFKTAFDRFGRVDIAVYSAGVSEPLGWVISPEASIESVQESPIPLVHLLEINLHGAVFFARIALAYLKDSPWTRSSPSPSRSITFISSAAAFQEGPGLCGYTASKAGMVGLMRSLRAVAPKLCQVRVNVISPWATDTAMIASHVHIFHEHKIPLNTPDDVAAFTQYVAASEKVNGQNVYIGGGRGFDIEDGLARTMPEWLGQENLDGWALQAKAFGQGDWLNADGK